MATIRKKIINKRKTGSKANRRGLKNSARDGGRSKSRSAVEVEGIVSLNRDGFGFVKVEGMEEDIFIPFRKLRGALNGDKVIVAMSKRKKISARRIEGEVIHIVERSTRPHIGILHTQGNHVWAIVESRNMPYDIKIQVGSIDEIPHFGGIKAKKGMKVAVLVTDWPHRSLEPLGKVVDILGMPGENDTEMHAILTEYELPYRFEQEVEDAANEISDKIEKEQLEERRDFRDVTTFTIDPTDAKDFDDALSFRELSNGNYEVGVHIADVTYYVTPGSAVDKEAYNRATSVYLVDRTVPMLPENLSNKLCSLRPHEDKLCYSAVFEMDTKANVIGKWFGRSVINSDHRFDYEEAQSLIETGEGPLSKEILTLHSLASILRKKRFDSGAISFERPEMKVICDEKGKPVDVRQKISKESNWLVEEFMLLANRSVAEHVAKGCRVKNPTFVYRIHDVPNPDKLEELRRFASNFGYTMGKTDSPKSVAKSLNTLIGDVKEKPEENALQLMALRSMARACYSTDNVGHYGLAFDWYTHFTSPIRRYPDMMVHRLLTMYMNGDKSQDKLFYEECCKWSSEREQRATDAERASIKYKMVEFMQDKIDQEFEGHISGLTDWGIYVEIEPTHIEGMVSLREITQDYLVFDEEKYQTVARESKRVFNLGDKVRIRVLRANLEQKLLDFELLWE